MSTFKVKLNNIKQGLMDTDPSTASAGSVTGQGLGTQFSVSKQRSVYVMGPGKVNRLLVDGATFIDCNYWKRFAYPQTSYENAFIEVVSDDGSVYSDVASENTFPVVWLPGASSDGVIVAADTYTDTNMELDILATYGGPAHFVEINNTDSSNSVTVRLNGSAAFTLAANTSQVFNNGDITITKIGFSNTASGASNVDSVDVILGVKSVCNS